MRNRRDTGQSRTSQDAGGRPGDRRAPVVRAVDDLARPGRYRGDRGDRRQFGDRLRVGRRQRRRRAGTHAKAARSRGTGKDDEQVTAHRRNRLIDHELRTLADRQHHDDRGDADHHAEHGQEGAQPVRAHRVPCLAEHRPLHAGTISMALRDTVPSWVTRPSTNLTSRLA